MGHWVSGWGQVKSLGQWVGSGKITKYLINLDIIEIIQFCLKIYDLLRHPHLWLDVWVDGWVNMWVNGGEGFVCTRMCRRFPMFA